jgi:predicted ester cyclase
VSIAANKANIRRVFAEALSRGEMAVIPEIFSPALVDHAGEPDDLPGAAGIEAFVRTVRHTFPDLHVSVEALFGEGQHVASVENWCGTHAATGERVEGTVLHVFRFCDGQVVEEWSAGWEWLASVPLLPAP